MYKLTLSVLMSLLLVGCVHSNNKVAIDGYAKDKINQTIEQVKTTDNKQQANIINLVSADFLGIPYVANTLIGSPTVPEKLVINFEGVDCFTYLDYVNALRTATSQSDFVKKLIATRYINSHVNFLHRKHFFSDWVTDNKLVAKDVTAQVSNYTVTITKYLNQKADGSTFIPTLAVKERNITYIPREAINDQVISQLKTGDYIGIYTPIAGLDVTHTGIVIKTAQGTMLRNASSLKANNKVVDSPFLDYVKKTPGIVVYRAL